MSVTEGPREAVEDFLAPGESLQAVFNPEHRLRFYAVSDRRWIELTEGGPGNDEKLAIEAVNLRNTTSVKVEQEGEEDPDVPGLVIGSVLTVAGVIAISFGMGSGETAAFVIGGGLGLIGALIVIASVDTDDGSIEISINAPQKRVNYELPPESGALAEQLVKVSGGL